MLTKPAMPSLLSVVALALGCSAFTGPADFPHAVAHFQCGPTDGPATGITLASRPIPPAGPSFPYVTIMIEQPLSAIAGRTFLVGSGAGATYFAGPNSYESASTGRVIIGSVDADSTITGNVSLSFSSRQVMDGFNAVWVQRTMLCG
jgi:hypothetical protein